MIAQWENECISLSVLFKARVMIAQWKNECFSLPVLLVARVMIGQRGRKWPSLHSMTPHNLWTSRRKAEVQPRTDNG